MSTLKEAVNDIITNIGKGKDIYLHGKNAKGVFYHIKKQLPPSILDTRFHDFSRGGYSNYSVIAIMGEDITLLEDPRIMRFTRENAQIILIDENGSEKPIIENRDFYSMEARFYLQREGTYDIDIGIADAMAHLFLDVFDAFVDYGDGAHQPYFRTSEIIEYSRSRPVLEGLLISAFQKFPQTQIIASREVSGIHDKNEVRMYELAESIAQDLKLDAVKIEETTEEDPKWRGDYTIRQDLQNRNVTVLDDVLMTGKTIESLRLAVIQAKGKYLHSIVLMNKLEEPLQKVYALTTIQKFMQLKKRRDKQNGNRLPR